MNTRTRRTAPPQATETFAAHYKTLSASVEQLRALDVSDLDRLVGLVEEAGVAYRGCKQRIEAIRALVDTQAAPSGA